MKFKHETIQSATSVAGVFVGIFGFVFIGFQLDESHKELAATSHERLLRHSFDVLALLVANPDIHPYLYDNAQLKDLGDDREAQRLRNQVLSACEIECDLFEHVTVQRKYLPKDVIKTWENNGKSMFKNSYEMRKFLKEQHEWYPPEMLHMVEFSENWPDQLK